MPALMQEVQTSSFLGTPLTNALTRWILGSQRFFVRRCECETLIPKFGRFPHRLQTAAINQLLHRWSQQYFWRFFKPQLPGQIVNFSVILTKGTRFRLASPDMEPLTVLNFEGLSRVIEAYRDALRDNQEIINRLNVYPVPDGDTGTNMALTLESVMEELGSVDLEKLASEDPGDSEADGQKMAAVCKAVGHGSLMGARGNSGIILSQILRGISSTLSGNAACDPKTMADALNAAALAARAAVLRPVEGTILTVGTAAAEAALQAAQMAKVTLVQVLEAARQGAVTALRKTPELLPVLQESGVVDAGGAGLVLLFDSLLHVTCDREIESLLNVLPGPVAELVGRPSSGYGGTQGDHSDHGAALLAAPHGAESVGDLRYEVMFLLEAPDEAIDAFKDVWGGVGDSIVVVGGEGIWNCHIHTGDIGAAIEAAMDIGRPRRIRVTDLAEQVEEEHWVRVAEESGISRPIDTPHAGPPPVTAVVAVATGDGVRRIFHSLGVHGLVTGGQSMNPSTAELVRAVEEAPASAVMILPNNKNIIAVANEVDALTQKAVRVVPTKGIVEGFAALLAYDPEAGPGENLTAMSKGAERVVAGEVTRAVRDASSAAGPIKEGDWLGLSREGIQVVAQSLSEACENLLDRLVGEEHEIVTIIEGDGSSVADTRKIGEWIALNRPNVIVESHHGGQPLYPYLFSIE